MSAANLSRLVKRSNSENTSHTIIDCRIPLEFNRSNMKGSINLHTKEMVQHFYNMYYRGRNAPKVLIFYSNHVIDEALRMAYFLRTLDLKTHNSDHTKLVFPTIYLLNESFKSFQKKFPILVQASTALWSIITSNCAKLVFAVKYILTLLAFTWDCLRYFTLFWLRHWCYIEACTEGNCEQVALYMHNYFLFLCIIHLQMCTILFIFGNTCIRYSLSLYVSIL